MRLKHYVYRLYLSDPWFLMGQDELIASSTALERGRSFFYFYIPDWIRDDLGVPQRCRSRKFVKIKTVISQTIRD